MDPQDDPEARIRELERPLAERARELGTGPDQGGAPPAPPPTQPWAANAYPPPPPGPPAPWPGYAEDYPAPPPPARVPVAHTGRILMVLMGIAVFLITTGIAAFLMFSNTVTSAFRPITDEPSARPTYSYSPPSPILPPTNSPATAGPGEIVNIAGASNDREVTCDGGTVMVSGVENTVTIIGKCATVAVSGIRNIIEVDESDAIRISGFENRVTYRSGEPDIARSGLDNFVERG